MGRHDDEDDPRIERWEADREDEAWERDKEEEDKVDEHRTRPRPVRKLMMGVMLPDEEGVSTLHALGYLYGTGPDNDFEECLRVYMMPTFKRAMHA